MSLLPSEKAAVDRQRMFITAQIHDVLSGNDFYMMPDPHTLGRYVKFVDGAIRVSITKKALKTWDSAVKRDDAALATAMGLIAEAIAKRKAERPDVFKYPMMVTV